MNGEAHKPPLHARLARPWFGLVAMILAVVGVVLVMNALALWPKQRTRTDGWSGSSTFWMTRGEQGNLIAHGDGSFPPRTHPTATSVALKITSYTDGSVELKIEAEAHDTVQHDPDTAYERTSPIPEQVVAGSWPVIERAWFANNESWKEADPDDTFSDSDHLLGPFSPGRFGVDADKLDAFVRGAMAKGPGLHALNAHDPAQARVRAVALAAAGLACLGTAVLLATVSVRTAMGRARLSTGRCPSCRFPIGSSPVCTECGCELAAYAVAVGFDSRSVSRRVPTRV